MSMDEPSSSPRSRIADQVAPTHHASRRIILIACLLGVSFLVFSIISGVLAARKSDVGAKVRLPDGSIVTLQLTAFTNRFTYTHQSGKRFLRLVAPILPSRVRNKLNLSGGSMSFGNDAHSNLFVVTVTSSD